MVKDEPTAVVEIVVGFEAVTAKLPGLPVSDATPPNFTGMVGSTVTSREALRAILVAVNVVAPTEEISKIAPDVTVMGLVDWSRREPPETALIAPFEVISVVVKPARVMPAPVDLSKVVPLPWTVKAPPEFTVRRLAPVVDSVVGWLAVMTNEVAAVPVMEATPPPKLSGMAVGTVTDVVAERAMVCALTVAVLVAVRVTAGPSTKAVVPGPVVLSVTSPAPWATMVPAEVTAMLAVPVVTAVKDVELSTVTEPEDLRVVIFEDKMSKVVAVFMIVLPLAASKASLTPTGMMTPEAEFAARVIDVPAVRVVAVLDWMSTEVVAAFSRSAPVFASTRAVAPVREAAVEAESESEEVEDDSVVG